MNNIVACPHCKKDVIWNSESEFRPFCSERCRLQDLGAWFMEEHKISDSEDTPYLDPENQLSDKTRN